MSKKQVRLRSLLATASIAAVIMGYSDSVLAQSRSSTGVAPRFSDGNNMDKDAAPANVVFANGSTFQFGSKNTTINADIANAIILSINTGTRANPQLSAIEDVSIGSTIGTTKLAASIQAGKKITLTGTASDGTLAAPNPANSAANQFVAAANTYTAYGSIDFAGAGSELIIDNSGLAGGPDAAEAGKAIALDGAFLNPANGTLNVLTPLIATDASVAEIATINVGAAGTASSLTIDGSAVVAGGPATIDILDGGAVVALKDAASILKLSNTGANALTFNLKANFDPSAAGGGAGAVGIVELNAHTGVGGLILRGDGGGETLGIAGDELAELRVTGDKQITIEGGANEVDLTNVELLNIQNSAGLIAQTATVTAIPQINIGKAESAPAAGDAIDGVLVIDSVDTDLQTGANKIEFKTADSVLKIQNISTGAGITVDLKNTLAVADETGIVQLFADNNGGIGGDLTIDNTKGSTFGTDNTHRLRELNVSGDKDITVNVGVFAKKITLDGTGAVKFTEAIDSGIGGALVFGADTPVEFGEDTEIETIDFNNNDGEIEVADGKKLTATLTSTGGVKGKVNFVGAGELIGGAAAGTGIESIIADGAAAVHGGAAAEVLKISGKHKATELVGTNASKIEFAAGAELDGGINTANGAAVLLDFQGNNYISGGIGRLGHPVGDITLAGSNKFKGDIYTSEMTANGGEFVVVDNTAIYGDFNADGTTLNLGEKTLTLEDAALENNIKIIVNTQAGGGDIGHVEVVGGKAVDLTAVTGVAIEMHTANLADVATKTYTLIRPVGAAAVNTVPGALVVGAAGGVIDYVDVTNGIITWSFNPATSTLTPRDNRPAGVAAAAPLAAALVRGGESAASAKEIADSIANAVPGSDGSNVGRGINEMPLELQAAAINDELPIVTTGENIAAVNSAVAEVITAAVSGNVAAISARMGDIASPVSSSFGAPNFDSGGVVSPDSGGVVSPDAGGGTSGSSTNTNKNNKVKQQSEAYGVAAGDETGAKMGLWGTPFYSNSIQKLRGETPGYKAISVGGTVGFDGMINDNSILGAAFTYVDTNIKHRNEKVGDKTKAATYMGSIYGVQSFRNSFFVQGILSYSRNKIRNNEFRSLTKETAKGRYNSDSYSGEVLLGRNFNSENGVITPMIGVRYTKFYDKGYTETGASINNLTVKKKDFQKCEGILGARLTGISYVNDTTLLPEIHGFVNHDFIGKKPKVDARFQGSLGPLATRAIKPTKTFYNVGTGITAKHNMMEYSIGYDAHLAKKYVGHQGSLKIRVNL